MVTGLPTRFVILPHHPHRQPAVISGAGLPGGYSGIPGSSPKIKVFGGVFDLRAVTVYGPGHDEAHKEQLKILPCVHVAWREQVACRCSGRASTRFLALGKFTPVSGR